MSSNKQPSKKLPKSDQENEAADAASADEPVKLSMADLLALKKQRTQSRPAPPRFNAKAKKVGDGPRGSRRTLGKR